MELFHPTFVVFWLPNLWSGVAPNNEYSRQMPNEPAPKNQADGATPLWTHSCLALLSLCTGSFSLPCSHGTKPTRAASSLLLLPWAWPASSAPTHAQPWPASSSLRAAWPTRATMAGLLLPCARTAMAGARKPSPPARSDLPRLLVPYVQPGRPVPPWLDLSSHVRARPVSSSLRHGRRPPPPVRPARPPPPPYAMAGVLLLPCGQPGLLHLPAPWPPSPSFLSLY
jgi:hypothetical protein